MRSKRLAAAFAGAFMLWGSAYAEQQPENTLPDATGATNPGIVILELQGGDEANSEDQLVLQLLLLQLLMMQAQQESPGDVQMTAPPVAGAAGI